MRCACYDSRPVVSILACLSAAGRGTTKNAVGYVPQRGMLPAQSPRLALGRPALPTYLPTWLPTHLLPIDLLPTYLPTYYLPTYLLTCLPTWARVSSSSRARWALVWSWPLARTASTAPESTSTRWSTRLRSPSRRPAVSTSSDPMSAMQDKGFRDRACRCR